MNKYLSHITNRVTLSLVGMMLLVMVAVIAHWSYVLLPVIKAGEQTKADLLVTPYTELLERAIDNKNFVRVDDLLNRLVLLVDPKIKKPMVLSIKITLVNGDKIEKQNSQFSKYPPFTAETPLFSPSSSELMGVLQLEYSAELFNNLITDAEQRLVLAVIVFIVILVFVQRHLFRLLHPLNELAAQVESVDFSEENSLPLPQNNISVEIKQVWQAIDQLFLRLKQRDEQVRLEHEAAQVALAEKIKAEAANRAKSQFLANMSHELRTPLNAIIGYSEILREEVIDRQQVDLEADLIKINSAGKSLLALISEVLDLSKIEAGKMQLYLEDVRVSALIEEVVDIVTPMAEKNMNSITIDCPDNIGVIHIDIAKLRQSLLNLLSNAAKFTHNGQVLLTVSRRPIGRNEWITIEIRDTGIGLTEQQINSLFVAFSQADSSTTRRYGGTGLGLTISRSFCRLMGGDIVVTSQPGEGSTFTVSLPVGDEQKSLLQSHSDPIHTDYFASTRMTNADVNIGTKEERRSKNMLVLVIDDDPMACDMPTRLLGKSGYEVICVKNATDGIEQINRQKPDIILLDVMLPGMSGWHVLTYVKEHVELIHIPVIMLTMVDEKNTAFALGASDYLMKPIDRELLVYAVNACVRQQGVPSILLIDHDAETRKLLRTILRNEGYFVVDTENGHLGLIRVAERKPAIILLDLLMPGMDGHEFLAQLRKNKDWQDIPVIALDTKDRGTDCKNIVYRVDGFLQKGVFSVDKVISMVRMLLSKKELDQKNTQPVTNLDDK